MLCEAAAAKERGNEGSQPARAIAAGVKVDSDTLSDFLGVRRFTFGMAEKENTVGQVTGLAWTEVGGDLLTIQMADMPGTVLVLSPGSLGDVMQAAVEADQNVGRTRHHPW